MCSGQPVSSANSSARAIASSSATTGRDAAQSRALGPREPAVSASFSACTATIRFSRAAVAIPACSVASSARPKSSMPEFDMKALKPITPRSASSSMCSTLPGTRPPQRPKSTHEDARAAASLASKACASVVGGVELSGMSK